MKKISIAVLAVLCSWHVYAQDSITLKTADTLLLVNTSNIIPDKLTVGGDIYVGESITGKNGEGARLYFQGVDKGDDPMFITRFNREANKTDLRINVGDDKMGDDRFIVGNSVAGTGGLWRSLFVVSNTGNVGIGTENPTVPLEVKGTVKARKVQIDITAGADFVFDAGYELKSLSEVEAFINENKHLPEIQSEKDMQENGLSVSEFQIKLLQKIEELTLYTIKQQKQIETLRSEINELKK